MNNTENTTTILTDAAHTTIGDTLLTTYYPGRNQPGTPIELNIIAVTPVGKASVDIRYTGFDGQFNGGKRRMRRVTPVTVRRTI